jgi:hypothetical protein
MGKRDTDGDSFNLSELPGKLPGSVVVVDEDLDSPPTSASSSAKRVHIGGAENFDEVELVRQKYALSSCFLKNIFSPISHKIYLFYMFC